ncbi:anillin-like isoform X2 [Homarus americanus]|uniref:anillin-like isoform X2 n=1 Tax=Homarus americanus TaxID=6706 RepID=UPI001C449571|nr:anillin-like isoform X2 [Homarus americanus]
MADPFVQRMMARSQARRAGIGKTAGNLNNKENASISDDTRSRLKQINSIYSDDTKAAAPLRMSNGDPADSSNALPSVSTKIDKSPNKVNSMCVTDFALSEGSQLKVTSATAVVDEGSTSPRKSRLNVLARRCQEMREWDDDYAYHSNNHGSQVEVGGSSAFGMNGSSKNLNVSKLSTKITPHNSSVLKVDGRTAIKTNGSLSPRHSPTSLNIGITTPKYYFGEVPSSMDCSDSGGSESPALSSNISMATSYNTPTSSSSTSSYSSAHQFIYPSKLEMPRNKTALHQTESPSSPTKKLVWDRGMLNSLEAQGFTPTDSRSRLYYDFKRERQQQQKPPRESSPTKSTIQAEEKIQPPVSPSKVRGMSLAEFVRSTSPDKMKSTTKAKQIASSSFLPSSQPSNASLLPLPATSLSTPPPVASIPPPPPPVASLPPPTPPNASLPSQPPPPPVVVSCLPKSPCGSPTRQFTRVPSPEPQPIKERARDTSPSKVGEMRSRWEQHIRQASPERSDRSRSPKKSVPRCVSPKKIPAVHSASHINNTSPKKNEGPSTSHSPVRNCSPVRSRSPHKYQPQSQGGLSRCGPERKSWRDLSPHKPQPVGKVVKGETAVPDAAPLVDQPFMSSVRERAAAFDNAGGRELAKDPAEMSVQERLALFSKKQGAALVPKAPFGQPVSAKALHGDVASVSRETSSKPTVAHSQPVHKPSKRLASEPSPVFAAQKLQQIQRGHRSPSPERNQPNSYESQKNTFENIKDNWRDNEINSKIQSERQKEMDLLLNRFKKPRQNTTAPKSTLAEIPKYAVESESEYLESDESYAESTCSEDMLGREDVSGPPKPPRLFLESSSVPVGCESSPPPPPPPTFQKSPSHRSMSSHSRLNSTEIGEVRVSPKKTFITKVKPGCIYPSLSDIESHSEAPESQDEEDVRDSSFSESVLTCASMESLGHKIQQAASANVNKPLSMIAETTESSRCDLNVMSESTMDALGAIDDAIDEALNDEPTPPKRFRSQDDTPSSVYKTPKINRNSPTYDEEDQENPLIHSISMYRKQRPEVTYTPVRQIVRRPDLRSPTPEPVSPSVTVSARIKELQEDVSEQQRVIAQASNAVTVVLQRLEQQGTPQHVEAEKLLLLASQKRQTALNEIQRIKAEGALGQQGSGDEDTCMGSISISNVSVPLKQDFLQKGMTGDDLYHLMVLVKHREQVISSQLLTTPECVVEGSVTFPNLMALHHLTSDFNITLEVYALCTHQQRHQNIKKEQSRMKLTPLKRLQKHDSRVASPSVQSPGGPYAVRTSAFQLVGFTHLNIATLTRNAWTLEKVPFSSPLDGHLLMRVSCSFEGGITERGFLTMFEDVGGFGAWNRRWCVLSGMHLRYWRYPDDEIKREASGQIDLRSCTTRRVELVARDICARQHTFQLTCLRPAHARDVTNLVQEVQGSSLVTKHLLSSDSKEERIIWCNKLNKSLANIRAWDPDALRPEDYQV